MARRAGLTPLRLPALALLALLVLLAHLATVDWIGQRLQVGSELQAMPKPMYTRMLQPQAVTLAARAPAARPAAPARRAARAAPPRAPASAPASAPGAASRDTGTDASAEAALAAQAAAADTALAQVAAVAATPTPSATAADAAASAPQATAAAAPPGTAASAPAAPLPQAAASAPAAPASTPAGADAFLAGWPADSRLNYRLGGQFRNGPLYGKARVKWQRDGTRYQVRIEVEVTFFAYMNLTSQGEITPAGLQPRLYEEERPGNRHRGARLGERDISLDNGQVLPRPPGVQDTASQMVELTHRFATGANALEVGQSVSFWMARPGAVDLWTYDIVERELLHTPKLGAVDAFHLKPRPIANPRGNITAEMWFAPALQYLPVRIRINMGEVDHIDLLVESIEQR